MNFDEAMALLGLDPVDCDAAALRRAYLAAIRVAHPDRNAAAGATAASAALTVAYQVAVEGLASRPAPATGRPAPSHAAPSHTAPAPRSAPSAEVVVLSDDTIEVVAPPDLAFAWLVQAGHDIGDVTFLDRSAALLQLLVQFVDEPVCQMIFDLQGRAARGTTEIFCTIDSIEDRPAPPLDAVTRLVAHHLASVMSAAE